MSGTPCRRRRHDHAPRCSSPLRPPRDNPRSALSNVYRTRDDRWLLVSLPNMTSAHVAIQVRARGPNSTIMSDWTAGLQAIGEAAEWIRAGVSGGAG